MNQEETGDVLEPVDGKFIFQVDRHMRVRFNSDGWVEEIGRGGNTDPMGTILQGKPGTKLDDVYARRYYDLYARAILLDVHPQKNSTDKGGCEGLILFRDLEPGSGLYERVSKVIAVANHHFKMDVKPLV
ncbi:MAG: hypothetical protein H6853_06890 [Rhodospirillales bacterium]|nr:hypothetical protein [Alphaproteobacteria bacterium]USO03254.1 MAG: hypothetical protein H6853_06890 [Rhodospirillales bacterium]